MLPIRAIGIPVFLHHSGTVPRVFAKVTLRTGDKDPSLGTFTVKGATVLHTNGKQLLYDMHIIVDAAVGNGRMAALRSGKNNAFSAGNTYAMMLEPTVCPYFSSPIASPSYFTSLRCHAHIRVACFAAARLQFSRAPECVFQPSVESPYSVLHHRL